MALKNTKQGPNIIYILSDDMGYGDLSCLNENSQIQTPNFDQIAKNGIAFTDAHSTSSVCTPSRYGILTGRYNWRSTLKDGVCGGYSPSLIEKNRLTVASMLKSEKYKTACIGKWHLGLDWARTEKLPEAPGFMETKGIDYGAPIANGPITHGFDYFYGISASLDMPPYVYIENDQVTAVPDHESVGTGKGFWRKGPTAPDFKHDQVLPTLTQKVLETIDQWADDPFYIYFPLPAPHSPILPTDDFKGKSKTNDYGDFVLMCDDVVGQVIAKLKEKDLLDNTILIYASDNGCSPTADFEELAKCGHNPNYIFRGHKADIYEGGHRIPLLVQWPDHIPSNQVSSEPVCLVDFMATVADIIAYDLPDNASEDSISNLDIWSGSPHKTPLREATVHHSVDGSFAIRKGDWKLELCPFSGGWAHLQPKIKPQGTPDIQLYNLKDNIAETNNVWKEYPEVVEELTTLLTTYISNGRSTPGKAQKNTGPAHWSQLHWM